MFRQSFLPHCAVWVALAALLTTVAGQAAAQSEPQPESPPADSRIAAAQVFIEESMPDLACVLIREHYGDDTRDPDALYLLALCTRDLGYLNASIGFYQRLVEVLPDAPKPKAELAALYAHAGRDAEARQLYREAASLQPGTPAAAMFSQLANAIISDDPAQLPTPAKLWQANIGLSATYDSNVNAGPSATSTAAVIGGVPVELDLHPSQRPRSSWGSTLNAGGRYLMPLSNNWGVLYQGNLSATRYFSERSFDTDSLALGAAFIRRSEAGSFSIQPNARYVRRDQDTQEATHGLSMNLGRPLSQSVQLGASLGYFHRRVLVSEAHDANGYTASASLQKALPNRLRLGASYFYQYEDARSDIQTRTLHGPSLFAMYPLGDALRLMANYRYVAIDYDARQPLFRHAREDDQHQVSLSATLNLLRWVGHNMELVARYNYTDNHSNLDHYGHDREVATLGVEGRF